MVCRLVIKKLIIFIFYKGVKFIFKGLKEVIRLVRNYCLWEKYLVEKLNYLWFKVYDEVERLEYVFLDDLMSCIYDLLG